MNSLLLQLRGAACGISFKSGSPKVKVPGQDPEIGDPSVQGWRILHEDKLPDAVQHHVTQEGCKGSVGLSRMDEVARSICQAATHLGACCHQPNSRDGCDHNCGPCEQPCEVGPLHAWDGALGSRQGLAGLCSRGDTERKVRDHEDVGGKLQMVTVTVRWRQMRHGGPMGMITGVPYAGVAGIVGFGHLQNCRSHFAPDTFEQAGLQHILRVQPPKPRLDEGVPANLV